MHGMFAASSQALVTLAEELFELHDKKTSVLQPRKIRH